MCNVTKMAATARPVIVIMCGVKKENGSATRRHITETCDTAVTNVNIFTRCGRQLVLTFANLILILLLLGYGAKALSSVLSHCHHSQQLLFHPIYCN